MTGAQLIAKERQRQISKENWTAAHDDEHTGGELALAAACYATPVQLYQKRDFANAVEFIDPWPWESRWDKRPHDGNVLRPATTSQRIDLLIKAGALIAAEIDRLQRAHGPVST